MAEQDEREAYELRQREKGEAERQREEEAFDQMAYEGDLIRRAEAAESRLAALRVRLAALEQEIRKRADLDDDGQAPFYGLLRQARLTVADRLASLLSGSSRPDPSCHACGGPIENGEKVAIYHEKCDGVNSGHSKR